MREFLINYYSILTKTVILIAVIVGFLLLKKYKNSNSKYFIYFLCFSLFIELVGSYPRYFRWLGRTDIIEGTIFERNYWWYFLTWSVGSTIFYSWYFRKLLVSTVLKKILYYLTILFCLISLIYIIFNFQEFLAAFSNFADLFNMFIIILCATFFLYEMLKSDKVLKFYKSLNFYISSVILIWWLVTTPLLFFDLYSTKSDMDYVVLKWTIKLCANIFMYLTFAFALIWCKPEHD